MQGVFVEVVPELEKALYRPEDGYLPVQRNVLAGKDFFEIG